MRLALTILFFLLVVYAVWWFLTKRGSESTGAHSLDSQAQGRVIDSQPSGSQPSESQPIESQPSEPTSGVSSRWDLGGTAGSGSEAQTAPAAPAPAAPEPAAPAAPAPAASPSGAPAASSAEASAPAQGTPAPQTQSSWGQAEPQESPAWSSQADSPSTDGSPSSGTPTSGTQTADTQTSGTPSREPYDQHAEWTPPSEPENAQAEADLALVEEGETRVSGTGPGSVPGSDQAFAERADADTADAGAVAADLVSEARAEAAESNSPEQQREDAELLGDDPDAADESEPARADTTAYATAQDEGTDGPAASASGDTTAYATAEEESALADSGDGSDIGHSDSWSAPTPELGRRISDYGEVRDGGFGVGSAAAFPDGAQPLGHAIQGDRESQTYRVPGAPGYDETEPDVWFYDEDAARRAGFSPATEHPAH